MNLARPPSVQPAKRTRCPKGSIILLNRQGGVVVIIVAATLIFIIGMVGMAVDLARVYNRRVELESIAKGAAFAAARQLDGTKAGVQAAQAAAQEVIASATYAYGRSSVVWSDSALKFSAAPPPNASWTDSGAALASPGKMFYVKVDLGALDNDLGLIRTVFMHVVSSSTNSIQLTDSAIAGRTGINVTPLAICALSPVRAAARTNPGSPAKVELVEFGFRRGVSYDLMRLNSNGTTAQSFVIDPISPPGSAGALSNTSLAVVGPFVCAGQMWMPHLEGGQISVASPFPLASLYPHLNSRFGQYASGACKAGGSPPDFNIKQFTFNGGSPWMSTTPSSQTAATLSSSGKLWTVADPEPVPAGTIPAMYGTLWSYARAVPFAEYTAGEAEPEAGYRSFAPADWPVLYKAGTTATSSYPTSPSANTPYLSSGGTNFLALSTPEKLIAKRTRRVLNVPLLACPVTGSGLSTATVLGVGRFFMTVPATSTSIFAEFAGAADSAPGGVVELL